MKPKRRQVAPSRAAGLRSPDEAGQTIDTTYMKTYDSILANSDLVTVVNDGQVRFPVLTSLLEEWQRKHGRITVDNYEAFCADVPPLGERVGIPGSPEMVHLCAALMGDGADMADIR